MINTSIIKSLLDNDLYTFSVGQLIHSKIPSATVSFTFHNRGKTNFPVNFVAELKNQLEFLSQLKFTDEELAWLRAQPFIKSEEYMTFLANYQFDPNELEISNVNGDLSIKIKGNWARTIMWEVPLLALISELYYILIGHTIAFKWAANIMEKARALEAAGCQWMEFGTRRRYSRSVQVGVIVFMYARKGFMGTSNCYLAHKFNIKAVGTMSHQFIMGISGMFGVKNANKVALALWREYYGDQLAIFLPDTFTTKVFLRDFDADFANAYAGLRQDSGDPEEWMDNIIQHYKNIQVDLSQKNIFFSDSLNVDKAIRLHVKYNGIAKVGAGIGTNFTNDVGAKPLNIVIKLDTINDVGVVKLSDVAGKYTGDPANIAAVKQELGI